MLIELTRTPPLAATELAIKRGTPRSLDSVLVEYTDGTRRYEVRGAQLTPFADIDVRTAVGDHLQALLDIACPPSLAADVQGDTAMLSERFTYDELRTFPTLSAADASLLCTVFGLGTPHRWESRDRWSQRLGLNLPPSTEITAQLAAMGAHAAMTLGPAPYHRSLYGRLSIRQRLAAASILTPYREPYLAWLRNHLDGSRVELQRDGQRELHIIADAVAIIFWGQHIVDVTDADDAALRRGRRRHAGWSGDEPPVATPLRWEASTLEDLTADLDEAILDAGASAAYALSRLEDPAAHDLEHWASPSPPSEARFPAPALVDVDLLYAIATGEAVPWQEELFRRAPHDNAEFTELCEDLYEDLRDDIDVDVDVVQRLPQPPSPPRRAGVATASDQRFERPSPSTAVAWFEDGTAVHVFAEDGSWVVVIPTAHPLVSDAPSTYDPERGMHVIITKLPRLTLSHQGARLTLQLGAPP